MANPKRQGTRVYKKSSPNGKITVYLGRRDFVDHISHVDPIDGVVLVDPEYLKDRKVFGHVLAAFRYGREDLDVLVSVGGASNRQTDRGHPPWLASDSFQV
ncbi:Kurtz [Caligus rogercresseyi]|uniref:Kurtz n=1 Tax=Caligus rogercresseyi TaxID=217165 RepID=A0A7T8GXW9_CALRO|nr:Kurtz [Caligus rogercresseyi]